MQLQPFKRRSSGVTIDDLRTMQDLHAGMRTLYTRPPDVSYAEPEVDAQAELPLGPMVGDLHPWDALVDGCLYLDDGLATSGERYAMARDGDVEWIMNEDDSDIGRVGKERDNRKTSLRYASAASARVLAVGLKIADEFRSAIVAHRMLIGGAK